MNTGTGTDARMFQLHGHGSALNRPGFPGGSIL